MSTKLSPQARRLRTIIVTIPIMAATSLVLYERLVLGKPRRTVDRSPEKEGVPMIPDDEGKFWSVPHIFSMG
ncbi:hypothetical protein A0H81_03107 [Grifola frondosa]|uniref:Uncharacterized protein n=1 Tax=Grifola frondosa TaxID=5627 RepID=A0A1C7MHP6_GRIFR|nr:hypothetical protein A0H81_03107 [Grifola frondosa]